MRVLAAAGLTLCLTGASGFAQSAAEIETFRRTYVQPNLESYITCAGPHLGRLAAQNPERSFEQVEGSLRPACGVYYDKIKEALFRAGFDRNQANAVVRSSYSTIQGNLRAHYESLANAERRRREAASLEAIREKQATEARSEQDKILKVAVAEHGECLAMEMRSLVPYSNESAETLAQVVITKCAAHEGKIVSLGVAFSAGSRTDTERIVRSALEDRKKKIVADIVTFRAELAKAMLNAPKQNQEKVSPAKESGI